MSLHNAYAVQVGSTVLAGLNTIDLQMNAQVSNEVGIGSAFPQFLAITEQRPRMAFAAKMVADALDLTGSTGQVLDASNTLIGYLAQLGGDGLPLTGTVHRSYTMNRGLLMPRRLTCSHRQAASLDMEAMFYSADGDAHPIAIADTVALPTLAVADVEHTLGAVKLGITGSQITFGCLTSLSVDFGNGAQTLGCDSDVYDTHVEQPGIRPVITLTGLNAAVFGSAGVPPVGLKVTHAGTSIYLRKRNAGIGFVADATAEHIKLTADGVAVVTQHTGQGTSRAEVTLQLYCGWDGTNAPIVIDTSSAIT